MQSHNEAYCQVLLSDLVELKAELIEVFLKIKDKP